MASDRLSAETKDLVNKTYAYANAHDKHSRELRHIASTIAYLYNSSIHVSCPAAPPRSSITRDSRIHVPMHYNSPRGMKPLNSMLRHAFNYFNDIKNMMNFDDYEARGEMKNAVFFHARSVCATISEAFAILVESTLSKSKDETARRLFGMICEYVYVLPRTLAEEERAAKAEAERAAAAAELRAKAEAERKAAQKAEEDKARAAADARARAHGFESAADVW